MTNERINQIDSDGLLTKDQLATQVIGCSTRHVEHLMQKRIIPFVKLGNKFVRFHRGRVLKALEKFETVEVGRE